MIKALKPPPPPAYEIADTNGGYITFTKSFQYLGSIIMSNLHDNKEIHACIKKATSQVGGL